MVFETARRRRLRRRRRKPFIRARVVRERERAHKKNATSPRLRDVSFFTEERIQREKDDDDDDDDARTPTPTIKQRERRRRRRRGVVLVVE